MPESSQINVPTDRPATESERRIWFRYPTHRAVFCQSAAREGEPFWPARASDVSLGGVKLVAAQKVERGTILKLGIASDGNEKSSSLTAEVRYATPTPEGKWMMGCAFLKELNEKDLLAWLQE